VTGNKTSRFLFDPDKPNPGPRYLGADNLARDKYKRPEKLLKDPDAIVIGSGIGGLGIASILAQKRNAKVLVLEANSVPGGCMHCHEIDGYEFNSGVDSIGDMDPTIGRGIYRPTVDYITGDQLQWAKMPDVHEVCSFGEQTFDWFSSPEKNIEWVKRLFPGEGDIDAYYDLEAKIEWSAWAFAVTCLLPNWMPESTREGFYGTFGGKWRNLMLQTTADVFRDQLGFSDRLAAIFSYMYGNHGRTPQHAPFAFHAVNLFHYRYGAYYPVGGPGQIIECIVPIVAKAGGQVAVDCPVDEIIIDGGVAKGVRLEDGTEIRAPLVISDASAYVTFMDLMDRQISTDHGYAQRFETVRPSPAHLYLLLGYDEAIDLPKQIFWHMPEYDGIDAYDLDAADNLYKDEARFDGMGGYLLSPSSRDPVYAERYPDRSTVIVLAEAPHAWVDEYKEDPEFKKQLDEGVTEHLTKIVHRHMPQLKEKTPTLVRAGLPIGCNPRAWQGSSYGLAPTKERFTRDAHWLRPKTTIKNLYMTGQDAFTMGFCGSMLGSRMCYSAITGNWLHMLKKRP